MAIKRSAAANWQGTGKEGKGTLTTKSGVFQGQPYSFGTRFGDVPGTNPEELIGAAHAGCFSMKLAFVLNAAGFTADSIDTTATVVLDTGLGAITHVNLVLRASVPGLEREKFLELADDAKQNCPISKLLNAEISLDAELV